MKLLTILILVNDCQVTVRVVHDLLYYAFWKFGGKFSFLIRKGKPSYKEDNEVICTSYYSSLKPVEGGEISISLGMCVLILLY